MCQCSVLDNYDRHNTLKPVMDLGGGRILLLKISEFVLINGLEGQITPSQSYRYPAWVK